jgi:hypothetical protein
MKLEIVGAMLGEILSPALLFGLFFSRSDYLSLQLRQQCFLARVSE